MKKIKVKIYRSEIELYIGKAKDNVRKLVNRHGKKCNSFLRPFSSAYCFACYFETKKRGTNFVLSINKNSCSEDIYHEALHISYYILDYVCVKHKVGNHEALAYLQGYIATKVKRHLKSKKS